MTFRTFDWIDHETPNTGERIMSGKGEEVKGRVKEAAGILANDNKLRREGQIDQTSGKAKQAVEKVVDKTREAAKKLNSK